MRSQLDAMIASAQADGSGDKIMLQMPKGAKAKAPKAEKAPRANAGVATLHGAWTTHVLKEHSTESAEFKEFLAKRIASAKAGELLYNEGHAKVKKGKKAVGDAMDEKEAAVGAHTVWVAHWRKEHPADFETFKTTWETANPKESRVASAKASQASSDAEGESADGESVAKVPKKRGAKKMADMTPEEKAIAQAKRAANKAKKAATKAESEEEEAENFSLATPAKTPSAAIGGGTVPAPVAEAEEMLEAEEEPEDSLIPFTCKKIKYLRYGHLDEDGEGVWWEGGDIWFQNADGSKGAYAGQINDSKKTIDNSPAVMAAEPDIN